MTGRQSEVTSTRSVRAVALRLDGSTLRRFLFSHAFHQHYRDAVRPVLMRYSNEPERLGAMMECVQRGIERHVRYFDDMLLAGPAR